MATKKQIMDALEKLEADLAETMTANESALSEAIVDWAVED